MFLLGNTCGRRMDNGLAALLMGMSGLGMMLQFAINDALTGRLLGLQAAQGAIAGAVAVAVVLVNTLGAVIALSAKGGKKKSRESKNG